MGTVAGSGLCVHDLNTYVFTSASLTLHGVPPFRWLRSGRLLVDIPAGAPFPPKFSEVMSSDYSLLRGQGHLWDN